MNSLPKQDQSTQGVVFNIERYMVFDGPGIRTVVFLKGCPLRCLWCDNPESQQPSPQLMYFEDKCIGCGRCLDVCPAGAITAKSTEKVKVDLSRCRASGLCADVCPSEALMMSGRVMTFGEVVTEILKDEAFYARSSGGVTLGGGEPTLQPEFARDILRMCREKNIHTAIETSGYASWRSMATVLQYTQLVYLDIKHMDPTQHTKLTGQSNDSIRRNAERIFQQASAGRFDLVVRCTCVPGYNDSKDNMAETAEFLAKSKVERLELLRYHELGMPKYAVLERQYTLKDLIVNEDHLRDLVEIVRSYGLECRVL